MADEKVVKVETVTFSLYEEMQRIDPGFDKKRYVCYEFGGGDVKIMSKEGDPYDPDGKMDIKR